MESKPFDFQMPPYKQALYVAAASVVLMAVEYLVGLTRWFEKDPLFAWSIATAFLLFYAIFNSILSIAAPSFVKYWGQSIYSYLGLAACNGIAAWLFSGIAVNEAGSYKFIYLVITFGFLVFLSIVNFVKKIIQFAEKEEWNQPRPRKK